jgi:hypothetical protein
MRIQSYARLTSQHVHEHTNNRGNKHNPKHTKNNEETSLQIKQELLTLLNTTLGQNYIQFDNEYYRQNDGLAMGAPTSAVIAEIFIQHLERAKIIEILKDHHIIDTYSCVDDILIIYNVTHYEY